MNPMMGKFNNLQMQGSINPMQQQQQQISPQKHLMVNNPYANGGNMSSPLHQDMSASSSPMYPGGANAQAMGMTSQAYNNNNNNGMTMGSAYMQPSHQQQPQAQLSTDFVNDDDFDLSDDLLTAPILSTTTTTTATTTNVSASSSDLFFGGNQSSDFGGGGGASTQQQQSTGYAAQMYQYGAGGDGSYMNNNNNMSLVDMPLIDDGNRGGGGMLVGGLNGPGPSASGNSLIQQLLLE